MALNKTLQYRWTAQRDVLCPECVICPRCKAAHTFGLTAREATIISSICEGVSNREIADSLNISEETVKRHLSNIMNKTGDDNRTALAMRAVRAGWVTLQAVPFATATTHVSKEEIAKRRREQ